MKRLELCCTLFLALLVCIASPAFAQLVPAPQPTAPPPRVPFSAFRTKPILELQSKDEAIKMRPANNTPTIQTIHPTPSTKPIAIKLLDKAKSLIKNFDSDSIVLTPQTHKQATPVALDAPTPAHKPVSAQAQVEKPTSVAPPPSTPTQQADTTPTPATTTPLKVTTKPAERPRARFSSQKRISGSITRVGAIPSLSSLGLPSDMQDLRLGPLEQAEGISPVLIPGKKTTMAAPDSEKIDKNGIPNTVILFFELNSEELEVGQLDVLNADVLNTLKKRPDLKLEIVGYAETQPPQAQPPDSATELTRKLSVARAFMVRQYLIKHDIDAARLTAEGEADHTPIEPRARVEMYFAR